ncbi:putative ubiquitin-like modifier [Suillus variegatus]|nr:putative ubiquitin-like modifier [Suillus variegatus]
MASGSPDDSGRQAALPWTPDVSESATEALQALDTYKKKDPSKGRTFIRLLPPTVSRQVIQFLRKELGWKAGDPLFTYINLAFSPAPDDTVSNLYKSFATEGHLIVNYSTTAAWG